MDPPLRNKSEKGHWNHTNLSEKSHTNVFIILPRYSLVCDLTDGTMEIEKEREREREIESNSIKVSN